MGNSYESCEWIRCIKNRVHIEKEILSLNIFVILCNNSVNYSLFVQKDELDRQLDSIDVTFEGKEIIFRDRKRFLSFNN